MKEAEPPLMHTTQQPMLHLGLECKCKYFGNISEWASTLCPTQITVYHHQYLDMWFLHIIFQMAPFTNFDDLNMHIDQNIIALFSKYRFSMCARLLFQIPPFNFHPLALHSWPVEKSHPDVIQIWTIPFKQDLPLFIESSSLFITIACPRERLAVLNHNVGELCVDDIICVTDNTSEFIKAHLILRAAERISKFPIVGGVLLHQLASGGNDSKPIIICTPGDFTMVCVPTSPTNQLFDTDSNGRYLFLPSVGSLFCPPHDWPSYLESAGVRVIATSSKVRSNMGRGFYMTACMFDRDIYAVRTSAITYLTPLAEFRGHKREHDKKNIRPTYFVGAHRCDYVIVHDSRGDLIAGESPFKKGITMGPGGIFSEACITDQSCTLLQYTLALGIATFVETVCFMRLKLESICNPASVTWGRHERTPWDLSFTKMLKKGPFNVRLLTRIEPITRQWVKWETVCCYQVNRHAEHTDNLIRTAKKQKFTFEK